MQFNYTFKKEKNFFFGLTKNTAKIYIKRTYSNVFVTLTDLQNKVVVCKTSGSSDSITTKRRKKIAQAVEKIASKINQYLKLYNITKIHLVLKMRIKAHVYTLLSKLHTYGLFILTMTSRRLIAHNGVKGRNLRRL